MLTRKQIRKNRWWRHILSHLPQRVFGSDMREIKDYHPEQWRDAFERFQSHGNQALTEIEREGILPLIAAQKGKEILLTSLAEECMSFWAKGWGWIHPIASTLAKPVQPEEKRVDRLTRVAILRMLRNMRADVVDFFIRHPGIKEDTKQRHLAEFLSTADAVTRRAE